MNKKFKFLLVLQINQIESLRCKEVVDKMGWMV